MRIKKKEYEELRRRLNDLEWFYYEMKQTNGVLTGQTVSYNLMRNLVQEIIDKLESFGWNRYALEYRQKMEHIDKIAWHNSIEEDACIGGYDWLFNLED